MHVLKGEGLLNGVLRRLREWADNSTVRFGVLLVMVVAIAYWPIIVGGYTLGSASSAVGSNGFAPFPGQKTSGLEDTGAVRLDSGASAWAFEPWAEVTNEALWNGEIPLWNPYQGAGAPLAANGQSSVFDPLLLPVNLFPSTWMWDLTALGALLLGAFGFLAFSRFIGLSHVAGSTIATAYALSGFFFLHSNNGFIRTYAYLPLLLAAVEWCLRRRDALPVAAIAGAVAGCLLVGMPESAFLVLLAVGGYALWRLAFTMEKLRTALRLAGGAVLGLALAAPFLLPFAEYLRNSHSSHGAGSQMGRRAEHARLLLGWVVPFVEGERWGTRSWIGAAVVLLALLGLRVRSPLRRTIGIPIALLALLTTLKVVDFPLVRFVGDLPFFERVAFVAWASPIVAGSLSVLAGLGVESIRRRLVRPKDLAAAVGVLLVFVGWGLVLNAEAFSAFDNRSLAIAFGLPVATIFGLVWVVLRCPVRWSALAVLGLVIVELLVLAPFSHYAVRADPFEPDDWHRELVALDQVGGSGRIFALDGLLFPNTAGVFGLSDIRMLDALYVDRYWRYVSLFIEPEIGTRFVGGPYSASEELSPARFLDNPMFDLLGVDWVITAGEITQTALQERLELSIQASPALRGGYMDLGLGWKRYAFFQHAPNRTTLPLEPPLSGVLSFRYGLDRTAFEPATGSDGVAFGVDVVRSSGAMERVWTQIVEPGLEEFVRGWRGHSLVIGQDLVDPVIAVELLTEPLGSSAMDWSGWIDLSFESNEEASLEGRLIDSIESKPELRGDYMTESREHITYALFQHTPGDLALPLDPRDEGLLSFRYGLDLVAMDPAAGGDGVRFAVEVGPREGTRERLWTADVIPEPVETGHRWSSVELALDDRPDGHLVWLRTETLRNNAMDWSGWADLRFTPTSESHGAVAVEELPQLDGPLIRDEVSVVYRNTHASPIVFVVHDIHVVPGPNEAEEWFRSRASVLPDGTVLVDQIDPERTAVIEAEERPEGLIDEACDEPTSASITQRRTTRVQVQVTAHCPGLLVLTETFFPGWEATIDGRPAEVFPTDIAFRGVVVPTGTSLVEFAYRPSSFRNGVILMLAAVVILIALIIGDRRRPIA